MIPSTPGVRAPFRVVTRCTANNFPENEWAKIHCKDLTLFHFLSVTAFAIRICSLRTSAFTLFQLMDCRSRWSFPPLRAGRLRFGSTHDSQIYAVLPYDG